jgi:hypothetical protein
VTKREVDTEQRDGLIYYFLPENSGGALDGDLYLSVALDLFHPDLVVVVLGGVHQQVVVVVLFYSRQ